MFQMFKTATVILIVMTALTGVVYPVALTVFAQVAFPREANGSLFSKPSEGSEKKGSNYRDWQANKSTLGAAIGSDWIGQSFTDPKYFWGRPSSTAPFPYNPMGGSGSNQAPTNPALMAAVKDRVEKLRKEDPGNQAPVPVDLVTASSSGLDPHISEAAALYQVSRVARVRQMDTFTVNKIVLSHLERPTIGVFGQTRVNVLKLNLALDEADLQANAPTNTDPQ